MTVWRAIGACVLVFVLPVPALSQTAAAPFEHLAADGSLRRGDTIHVTDVWGYRVKGRLVELRDDSLVVVAGSRTVRLPAGNVGRIQRKDSKWNGLLIGLAAGIAAASIAPRMTCDLPDDECAAIVVNAIGLPAIAAGTLTGALVDASIKKTVFQRGAPGTSARLRVSPVLGGRALGARATLQF